MGEAIITRRPSGTDGTVYLGTPATYPLSLTASYQDVVNISGEEGTLESIEIVGYQTGSGGSGYVYLIIDVDGENKVTDMQVIKIFDHNSQINGTCLNLPLNIKYSNSVRLQAKLAGTAVFYATAFVRKGQTKKVIVKKTASMLIEAVPFPSSAGVWEELKSVVGSGVIESLVTANWRTDTSSSAQNSYLDIILEIDGVETNGFRFATHGGYNSNDCVMCSSCTPRFQFQSGFKIKGYKASTYTGTMHVCYHIN